jgi:predicted RNase H-like nuclease (RuvC/YqgF family)
MSAQTAEARARAEAWLNTEPSDESWTWPYCSPRALARDVLALSAEVERLTRQLRDEVSGMNALGRECADLRAEVERLTRERDEAEKRAEEAEASEREVCAQIQHEYRIEADLEARADRLQQALEEAVRWIRARTTTAAMAKRKEVLARAAAALAAAADTETPGHLYNGSFELSWLADGEMVLSAGDGNGACEIAWESDGRLLCRLEVGDRLKRGEDGRPIAIRPAGAEQQT